MGGSKGKMSLRMRTTEVSARKKVEKYLNSNRDRLKAMSPEYIFSEVRRDVLDAPPSVLSDFELRAIIAAWRIAIGAPPLPVKLPARPTPADNKLVEAVKKAVTTVIEGVDIKRGDGKLNIGVTGLTAELKKGATRVETSVSWGGALGAKTSVGDFLFSASLSSERWELRLSYPQDTVIPDLSKVGKVFGEGEKAMREIIGATSSFRDLSDAKRIKDAVTPHLGAVKKAVTAAKGVAKAPRVSGEIIFSSPDPLPGETERPGGWQVQAVFTVRF